jgi:ferredoxin
LQYFLGKNINLVKGENDMARTPWVDKDECISCEACVGSCPGVFRIGDDGKSECFDANGDSEENIQAAMDQCPVSCIHWKE